MTALATLWPLHLVLGLGGLTAASASTPADPPLFEARPHLPAIRDKTLVVWTTLADREQRGGSALTLERRDAFDAIVFGENRPHVWMNGSDGFARTQHDQSANPEETAGPDEVLRLAVVYSGGQVTFYRNDATLFSHTPARPPLEFGDQSCVLIGLRHLARAGAPGSYFAGVVHEARLYDRALSAAEVRALTPGQLGPSRPLGCWNFADGTARDVMGTFPPGELHGGAVIRDGGLHLNGVDAYMATPAGLVWHDPLHFRPSAGVFGDPIPLFANGEYHVFYLIGAHGPCNWRHIVSKDLMHWTELPEALVVDGAADGPDGGAMFTGSALVARDGGYHIYYTGHNDRNPAGVEVVRHATSPDLIHWTKHPDETIAPDGVIYSNHRQRDWRDPYVFWNEAEQQYWMVLFANAAGDGHGVQGLLTSKDLRTWQPQPPLPGAGGQECPDLFQIGDHWYLLGGDHYSIADQPRGPYRQLPHHVIDRPGVYAGKRQFDGRRHIWSGWTWDVPSLTDKDQNATWGGNQCLPRELYAGPDGQLGCRPAAEITAAFSGVALDLAKRPAFDLAAAAVWDYDAGGLMLRRPPTGGSQLTFPAPGNCLVDLVVRLDPEAQLTVALREPADGPGYRFLLRPGRRQMAIATEAGEWTRDDCAVDCAQPIKIQLYLVGTNLECFVNDTYALTRRAYDRAGGRLGLSGSGGAVEVQSLVVRTLGP